MYILSDTHPRGLAAWIILKARRLGRGSVALRPGVGERQREGPGCAPKLVRSASMDFTLRFAISSWINVCVSEFISQACLLPKIFIINMANEWYRTRKLVS